MSNEDIDRQKLYQKIVVITSTISDCYSYPAWHSKIKLLVLKPDGLNFIAMCAVQNASLIASMVKLRAMHNFLEGTQRRPDDLVYSDYQGLSRQTFLDEGEKTDINKRIAHLTKKNEFEENFDRNLFLLYERVEPIFETVFDELQDNFGGLKPIELEIALTRNFVREMHNAMRDAIPPHNST